MPKQRARQEFNSFVAGLNSDANPINFPEGFSLDEKNMIIDINGCRRRRNGLDAEASYQEISTGVANNGSADIAFNTYRWRNAGGDASKTLLVVQVGDEFDVLDVGTSPISGNVIYNKSFASVPIQTKDMSFATVDGILVVATGTGTIHTYEYDGVSAITERTTRLKVRDFFGVEDIHNPGTGDIDLTEGTNIAFRPQTLSDNHKYNLRNQGYGPERASGVLVMVDTIVEFFNGSTLSPQAYPSNADNISQALAPSPGASNPIPDRFFPADLVRNAWGNTAAPKGYFIIDVLSRGASRVAEYTQNDVINTANSLGIPTLSDDETDGGATVTTEYAGRAWFAGFPAAVTDGDTKSPQLSSYVLFSQVVNNVSDINKCYQVADPTSPYDSDLVATDGGYIRINGAFGIKKLINIAQDLYVIAENGVWKIGGGSDFGFAADNFRVDKVSNNGCLAGESVVEIPGGALYWGDDGIYAVGLTETGVSGSQTITQNKLQDFYNLISKATKLKVKGKFDSHRREAHWIYHCTLNDSEKVIELVYTIDTQAFSYHEIQNLATYTEAKVVAIAQVEEFNVSYGKETQLHELMYMVVTDDLPVIKYTLASYNNRNFLDWGVLDGTGIDAAGFLESGYLASDDNMRRKQAPKLVVVCERTEDGVYDAGGGDYQLSNPSSCLVQARWNWTNSGNANRWSPERQFYRYKRHYIPSGVSSTYDTGDLLIVTKDRLRGHGKNVSLKFSTEAGKDMHLHGWMIEWEVSDNEGS